MPPFRGAMVCIMERQIIICQNHETTQFYSMLVFEKHNRPGSKWVVIKEKKEGNTHGAIRSAKLNALHDLYGHISINDEVESLEKEQQESSSP